ncbi:MAG: diaminopimelate epimerase [Acidimicrobiia bacterium]
MTTLTKHHGLGNDFLVLFDDQPLVRLPFEVLAKQWCDRRRGFGADGLLIGLTNVDAATCDVGMVLYNADGSRAEMSGNGIRCLAQAAAARIGMTSGTLRISTDAGVRTVAIRPGDDSRTILASVDMGEVTTLDAPAGWHALGCDPMRPVAHLGLGNPHSVVGVEEILVVDLATLGAKVPDVNLEVVEPGPEAHAITMRVHERGAGITEACGTGACASAWAAVEWGLIAASVPEIVVHMDGGDATVRLHEPECGHVTLTGPATFVGTITA